MEQLGAQYRLWTTDASKITDAECVKSALRGDKKMAADILLESYRRMYVRAFEHEYQHPVVKLLGDLAFGEIPLNVLQKQKSLDAVMENFRANMHRHDDYKNFLQDNSSILGDDFLQYLQVCFAQAVDEYCQPRLPEKKRRRKNWLAIGFNLAWAKKDAKGNSDNQERDADITQSVHLLIEQYVRKHGNLRSGIERFLNGDSDLLPSSIDRLIKLKGYVGSGPYIKWSRTRVAKPCLDILKRVESAAKGSRDKDHSTLTIASEIYVECSKTCKAHLLKILADIEAGNTSACCGGAEDEIIRIRERLATLNSYGAEPVGKGKKGTGAPGIAGVYSENQHRLPTPDRRRNKPKTQEQLEAEYWLLLQMPVIGEALRLIDSITSLADCDEVLLQLNVLRGKTPTGTEHMWPGLVARFNAAQDAVKEKHGEPRRAQL